ncbi:hypothetical protein ACTFIZ_011295 [Dictyostelium cf. discoideum]
MISRPLSSLSIGKTISNNILKNSLNLQLKSNFLKNEIPQSNLILSQQISSTSKLSIYKFNINEFKNHFSTTNSNSNNNNNNNNNSNNIKNEKEPEIKSFEEVFKEEMSNKFKSKDRVISPIPISSEAKLIFENNSKFTYKLLFFCGIVQFMLFLFVLEDLFSTGNPTALNYWAFAGAVFFTILTQLMVRDRCRKALASIHTYNKGRVIELTSYSITGFPTRKRVVNINNIISSAANDSLPTPLTNKIDKTFFIRVPGQGYFEGKLKGSTIFDPIQLDKIINISKAENTIKEANKSIKKQQKKYTK